MFAILIIVFKIYTSHHAVDFILNWFLTLRFLEMDATDSIDVPEADATANEIEAADEQNCQGLFPLNLQYTWTL